MSLPPQSPQSPEDPPSGSGDAAQPQAPSTNRVESAGFIKALFDFSFQSFVTIKFSRLIYAIFIAFIAIGWFVGLVGSFVSDPVSGLLFLLLGTMGALIYLVLIRVMLEFFIAAIRTAQNTGATRSELESLRWDLSQRS